MSPAKKVKELLFDVDTLRTILIPLLGMVIGLVGFEYHRITGSVETRLAALEVHVKETDATIVSRGERLKSLEDNSGHLKGDIDRLSGDKIDRLTEQLFAARRG